MISVYCAPSARSLAQRGVTMRMEVSIVDAAFHSKPDPVIEVPIKKDVDRTLIRENLRLSVEQRLKN